MRPQPLVKSAMGTLDEEIIIGRAEYRRQGVGIDEFPFSARVCRSQAIGKPARAMLGKPFEKAAAARRERDLHRAVSRYRCHALGMRDQGADHNSIWRLMRTKHGEGVGMACRQQGLHLLIANPPVWAGRGLFVSTAFTPGPPHFIPFRAAVPERPRFPAHIR